MPSGALASRPIAPAMVIPIPTRAGESPTVRVRNRAQQVYQAPLPKLVISVAHMRRRTDACPGGASASPDSRGVLATHVMRRDPGRRALHLPWVRWAERELAATPLELPRVWPLLIEPYRQPEFLMPAPRSRLPDLEQELRQLLATTPSQVRAALARTFRRSPPPAAQALAAHPRRELRLIATEIENAFTRLVEPHWERIRTLLDADIVYRARTLADAGAARMFEQLHTGVSWHSDHLLFTDAAGIQGDPEVAAVGPGGLVLEPSVFIWPDLYIKRWTVTRTTVRYPVR